MLRRYFPVFSVLMISILALTGFSNPQQATDFGIAPEFWLALLLILVLLIILAWWALRHGAPQVTAVHAEPHEEHAPPVETEPQPAAEPAAEEAPAETEPQPTAEPAAEEAPAEPDDLKIIEGIGPKVSAALIEMGITTFAQVAQADPEELEKRLKAAGVRIISGAPATWPEQAALAAKGDWEGLEALQEQLKGGRRR